MIYVYHILIDGFKMEYPVNMENVFFVHVFSGYVCVA